MDDITIYDVDIEGGFDNLGKVSELWGRDALSNAIKMWINTKRSEIMRSPSRGGYIEPYLTKPLDDNTAALILDTLRFGLTQDFGIKLVLIRLDVIANNNTKAWDIEIVVFSPDLNEEVEVPISVSSLNYNY
jgi:hypothetical protein